MHREASTRMFGAELSVLMINWKQPKCPTKGDCFFKKSYGHDAVLYTAVNQKSELGLYVLHISISRHIAEFKKQDAEK